jgi:16S rRNA (cytidine1402-2'-O)-methyltransferase
MHGKLFLIPNIISEGTQELVITNQVKSELVNIRFFLAEEIRTARRFLSSLKIYPSIEELDFQILDKNTPANAVSALLEPLRNGHNLGVISESGCPGIADPGAIAVRLAHEQSFQVVPLVGPSSLLLALMASGLNGQRFAFHGYLPIDGNEASRAIRDLEKESRQKNQTQIAIETPYRNRSLLQHLIKNLSDSTLMTIAVDVTGSSEFIKTMTIANWRKESVEPPKLPAVFLFLAS